MKKKSLIALGLIAGAAIMLAGCNSTPAETTAPSETPVVESQIPDESLPPVNTEVVDESLAPVDESGAPDESLTPDDGGLTAPTETPAE
ncbi:MAG: hypothetical protein LUG13_08135 [Oscillospiraceae bacterium]|nr:hypothetical protein [Oscillospiraceae bacterium]